MTIQKLYGLGLKEVDGKPATRPPGRGQPKSRPRKRLARLSERLMQLARDEGGRLRLDRTADLRHVARLVVEDIARTATPDRIALTLPEMPVMSDLDPDAFGILCRNLVENALRHGSQAIERHSFG